MTIPIGRWQFEGPFSNASFLQDRSGVYAVLDSRQDGYHVLDVGESANVRTRLATHDRQNCWVRNCTGSLAFAAYYTAYTQQSGRVAIEQELRSQFRPTCGIR